MTNKTDNMKRIFLAIVAIVAASTLSAQDLRWGVTGGLNFANEHLPKGNSSDCYVGFNLGAKAELDLGEEIYKGFYASGRLLYTLKGGQWKNWHNNLGYIELPVNFGYRFTLAKDVSMFVDLGPYFAIGVVGNNVTKGESNTKIKQRLFGRDYKRFDCGLNYNLGVDIKYHWQCFVGFEHGFVNIMKTSPIGEDIKARMFNFYVGAAYMF
jgi:hypothetical protein